MIERTVRLGRVFAPQDLAEVEAAVREVEARTAGEIVPFVVERSDDYPEAPWKGAAILALVAAAGSALVRELGGFWGAAAPWIALPPAAGAAAGYLVTALASGLRRALVGREVLERRVRRRAALAFVAEEVFRTRGETGVLLFVSLFERRVVVLAGRGVEQRVAADELEAIARRVARGMRSGRPATALVAGVRECGTLLEQRGLAAAPDDRDELSDRVRTGKA